MKHHSEKNANTTRDVAVIISTTHTWTNPKNNSEFNQTKNYALGSITTAAVVKPVYNCSDPHPSLRISHPHSRANAQNTW